MFLNQLKKRKKRKNHNLRIVDLINNDFSTDEIIRIIYEEYSIRVSQTQINKKRDNNYIKKTKDRFNERKKEFISLIKEALNYENYPKKTIEIKEYIFKKYGLEYTKNEINQILWNDLKSDIYYFNNNFTYQLIKSISEKNNIDGQDKSIIIKDIKEALKYGNYSKKTQEIKDIISLNYGREYTKNEIYSVLWNELKDEINLFRKDYSYQLKEFEIDEEKKSFEILIDRFKLELNGDIIKNLFIEEIKKGFIKVSSGNKKIDDLIKVIVKDNLITETEEKFLTNKIKEYGLSVSILKQAKKSLHQNNPYLDNLIHLIFEDGIVENDELDFLKEKVIENHFNEDYVNKRFWQIGITYYTNYLLKVINFDKVIKLWYLNFKLKSDDNFSIFFESLNIFENKSLHNSIENGIYIIEKHLRENNTLKIPFEDFYRSIDFNNELYHELEIDNCHLDYFIKILEEERMRLGSPDANLLAENIKFRIEKRL